MEESEVFEEYESLLPLIQSSGPKRDASLNDKIKSTLTRWFLRKFIYLKSSHISGDDINCDVMKSALPGLLTKVVGLQNIKSPGIDFFYSWEDWGRCHQFCQLLMTSDNVKITEGLEQLENLGHYGFLSIEPISNAIDTLENSNITLNEKQRSSIKKIRALTQTSLMHIESIYSTTTKNRLIHFFIHCAEDFLEPGDSIRRRKKANKVYRDMANLRISYHRVQSVIASLLVRQRSGWFRDWAKKVFR